MKTIIILFIILFNLKSFAKADDIRDFEIEGMSLGDSSLRYVDKEFIEKEKYNYPGNNNLFTIFNIDKWNSPSFNFEIYDGVHINYKTNDKKYIIHSLRAKIYFENIQECYLLKKDIILQLEDSLTVIKKYGGKTKHWADESGKSKIDSTFLDVKGGRAAVQCYDWSKESKNWDNLSVSIGTSEYTEWLDSRSN